MSPAFFVCLREGFRDESSTRRCGKLTHPRQLVCSAVIGSQRTEFLCQPKVKELGIATLSKREEHKRLRRRNRFATICIPHNLQYQTPRSLFSNRGTQWNDRVDTPRPKPSRRPPPRVLRTSLGPFSCPRPIVQSHCCDVSPWWTMF